MRRRDIIAALGAGALVPPGCRAVVIRDPALPRQLDPISSLSSFYVFSCCGEPQIGADAPVIVTHEGQRLGAFDRAFLDTLQPLIKEHTLQCIGSGPRAQLIDNGVWTCVLLHSVLDALGIEVPATARDLVLWGHDGYDAKVPVSDLTDAPLFLAWALNDEPLPLSHGFPLRVLAPGRYGMKNVKWLAEVAFADGEHVSYYTPEGWSEAAVVRPHGFIASPPDGLNLEPDAEVIVLGTAFAGADPVTAVEISLDDGPWEPATLDYGPGADIWVLWSWPWRPAPGAHTLQVRVTTASGARSSDDPAGTDPYAGYDGSMRVKVRVG